MSSDSTATVGANPTMRIAFYRENSTNRTLLGNIDVPITGTVGVYNNIGNNYFQSFNVNGITTLSGSDSDLIGWEFVNRGSSNEEINAISRCVISVKIEEDI